MVYNLKRNSKLLDQIYLTCSTFYLELMSSTYASALIRSLYIIVLHNQGEGCHVRRLACQSRGFADT